jgi:ABC-2 type transport system ATP-binding protein
MTPTNAPAALGGIRLSQLSRSYGPIEAVRGIDLEISAGNTVALLGPNGAGKTTTIDMMLGLTRPDAGSVSIFERAPAQAVKAGLVGGMLQTGALIRYLSVRELIVVVASLYPDPLPVDEVLELSGAAEFSSQGTHKLSGGQTQRVRFATALVANPALLVLDEPTDALDVEGRRDFWNAMRAFAAKGRTVIFATHYLEEADAYSDRIVLIARGRVVADGPATEIKARAGMRTIRATMPGVALTSLSALPGVSKVEQRGETVTITCTNSDQAIRELVRRYPEACDIELRGAGLEEAFLELTSEENESRNPTEVAR